MSKKQKLEVRIKGPSFDPLEGWEGCGIAVIAIPALLYTLFKQLVVRRGKHDTWHVQVVEHKGLWSHKVIYEETFDSRQDADRRCWELTRQLNAGTKDFKKEDPGG